MAVKGRYSTQYEDTAPSGGVSDADILAYVQANINNPAAIAAAAAANGVSMADLSRATGISTTDISNYFNNAGVQAPGAGQSAADAAALQAANEAAVREQAAQQAAEAARVAAAAQAAADKAAAEAAAREAAARTAAQQAAAKRAADAAAAAQAAADKAKADAAAQQQAAAAAAKAAADAAAKAQADAQAKAQADAAAKTQADARAAAAKAQADAQAKAQADAQAKAQADAQAAAAKAQADAQAKAQADAAKAQADAQAKAQANAAAKAQADAVKATAGIASLPAATKTYTQAEVNQALVDALKNDPKASKADITAAAAGMGISAAQVNAAYSSLPAAAAPAAVTQTAGIASLPAANTQAAAAAPMDKAAAIEKITQQILAQGTSSKWKGEGKGSAEANARDMAKIIADTGATDISQFGKVTKTVDAAVQPVYGQGDLVTDNEGQQYYSQKIIGYVDQNGKPVDPSLVKSETVFSGGDSGNSELVYTAPVGKQEVFGNKLTGQEVATTYGERQQGNAFGGTFDGKGNTGYNVQFDAKGNPVFYTTAATSNDLAILMQDLGPIGQIGLAIATGGLSIPQQIAANMAISVLSGKDIGDAVKSAAISFAGAQIPGMDFMKEGASFIKDLGLSETVTKTLTNSFQNAAVSAGTALLSGENIVDAAVRGAAAGGTNGLVNSVLGNIDTFGDLTDTQKKLVTNAVTGVVSGKPLDQIVINTAIAAANSAVNEAKTTGKVTGITTKTDNSGASFADFNLADDTDTQIANQLNKDLTIDASGAKDVNAAAAFADAAGFNKFTFDGKTYTLGNDNAANTIANLETEALKTNTAANLAGGEFAGIDAQIAANAKANTTAIGNAEADSLEEAAALAKIRNPTGTTFTFDGKTYTLGTSSSVVDQAIAEAKTSNLKNDIANAPNRDAAFKLARDALGAGKTFTYNGKEYSTSTAEERPDLTGKTTTTTTGDQSAAETARLLAQNKTLVDASTANQSNAEVNRLLAKNADLITGNVTANQSAAETARLANLNNTLVRGNAPNESAAETQRLVEAGERSVAQNLNSFALQALGTTARGAASLIQNAGETYAQITGDFNYDNVATKLGKEIAEYAKGKDIYGLDVQKNRLTQSLAQADNTDNFFDKVAIIGSAIKKNPLGFFDVAGSEFVEELPETAIQIAAALLTGGGSAAVQMGGRVIAGTTSLIGSFSETFGAAGKEAFQKSIARGDSINVAKDKSYINAAINAVAEMVPDYFADKALIGPIMKNFAEKTLKSIGTGYATNTAAGVVSEFISGAAQNYSTQYVVDPKTASWSKAITNGIFESTIGGTVQTAMATPNTVVDTSAVIGRDYSGNNVTLQQVLDGNSNIDATTVNASTPIATKADGTSMTVGSSILFAQENNAGMDVLGSFLPANLTGTDVVVATDTGITATQAQQIMSDLGLNVTDDVAISLANKITARNESNQVTLGDIITDMTGKPANLTGKSDTSTVISVDTGAGTAVVMNSKGNTDVVNVSGDVKVGSVVTVNAATNSATATGSTVNTAANTATVVSVDAASGKAIVADSNGSSQVVNTSGDVQVGSTVTVNSGTATATNAATATAANAATNIAVTNAATTAADTAANAATTATTAANAATTSATDANAASTTNAATSTAANAATTAAAAADVATNAAAATNTATASNAASNAATATDVATNAADVATNVVADAATTPAVGTSQAVNTSTVVSVDKLDNSAIVQSPNGTFDVISNPGNVTVGDVIGQPAVQPPVVQPPAVTPPVTTPPTKTPATKTATGAPLPAGGGVAEPTPPPLANVFYYGKDFSTQKQEVGPGGQLQQTPYQALSVSTPGVEAPVAQQARTEENTDEAMLQKIFSQKENGVTMEELIRLLG